MTDWRKERLSSEERGYTWKWRQARNTYIAEHPLCVMCLPKRVTQAQVVDHKIPHKGDQVLFWDRNNWQSLCKWHHDSHKQQLEKSGRVRQEIGPDGEPID